MEFGGGGLSFSVPILLEREQASAEPAEGVEHTEVIMGVGLEVVFVGAGGQIIELLGELSDGELEADEGEFGGVIVAGNFEKTLLRRAQFSAAFAGQEFVLVTAFVPVGDVFEAEADALFGQFLADLFVGKPVVETLVNKIALSFGQVGDFAVPTPLARIG